MSKSRWEPFGDALVPIHSEQDHICALFDERLRPLRAQLRAIEAERDTLLAPLRARAAAIVDAYDRGDETP